MSEIYLKKGKKRILNGSYLLMLQNGFLFIWGMILFIGIKANPTLLGSIGVVTHYLTLFLDLIAFSILGIGLYYLAKCYDEIHDLARTSGLLLLSWAIISLIWRLGASLYSIGTIETVVQHMTPQRVDSTLTLVFETIYPFTHRFWYLSV